LAKSRLLRERDIFIAERINQTLGTGEAGIIFIGAVHKVKGKLPKGIQVAELKDTEKVRKYQRLLPFHNKHKEEFDELSNYLVSEVSL
jgi:pheromone shutdown protein TraB